MNETILAALLKIVADSNLGRDAGNPWLAAVAMKGLERGLSGDLDALARPYTDDLANEVHAEARAVGDAIREGSEPARVVVVVEGGIVSGARSNARSAEIVVRDLDDIGNDDATEGQDDRTDPLFAHRTNLGDPGSVDYDKAGFPWIVY